MIQGLIWRTSTGWIAALLLIVLGLFLGLVNLFWVVIFTLRVNSLLQYSLYRNPNRIFLALLILRDHKFCNVDLCGNFRPCCSALYHDSSIMQAKRTPTFMRYNSIFILLLCIFAAAAAAWEVYIMMFSSRTPKKEEFGGQWVYRLALRLLSLLPCTAFFPPQALILFQCQVRLSKYEYITFKPIS